MRLPFVLVFLLIPSLVFAKTSCFGINFEQPLSLGEVQDQINQVFPKLTGEVTALSSGQGFVYSEKSETPLAQWWDLYYFLKDQGATNIDLLCDRRPTYGEGQNPPPMETGPLQEKACLENSDQDPSCDPYWALKAIGLLQQDDKGVWSTQWMQELYKEKKELLTAELQEATAQKNEAKIKDLTLELSEMALFGEGVLIGHPDTGYTDHPELNPAQTIDHPENFTLFNPDAYDDFGIWRGHGSATASTIVSPDFRQIEGEKNKGPLDQFVLGVAPKARIRPYRVSTGTVIHWIYPNLIHAINSAIDNNRRNDVLGRYDQKVKVLSMSLGGPLPSIRLHRAFQNAVKMGMIPVSASGNMIPDFLFDKYIVWPAHYQEVIAVAATNVYDNPWVYSSQGPKMDIAAPGEGVWRASVLFDDGTPTYGVARGNGTSYATALVAGSISLWLAFHGESKMKKYDPYRVELVRYLFKQLGEEGKLNPILCDRYTKSCSRVKKGNYGPGIINVKALLEAPLPDPKEFIAWQQSQGEERKVQYKDAPLSYEDANFKDLPQVLEMFQNYYPNQTPSSILKGLAKLLELSQKDTTTFLDKHGYEFAMVIGEDPKMASSVGRYLTIQKIIDGATLWKAVYYAWKYRAEIQMVAELAWKYLPMVLSSQSKKFLEI